MGPNSAQRCWALAVSTGLTVTLRPVAQETQSRIRIRSFGPACLCNSLASLKRQGLAA